MPTDNTSDCLGMKALKKIEEKFKSDILNVVNFRKETQVLVKKEALFGILKFLKEDKELYFDFLVDMTAVDRSELDNKHRFEVVYHLHSYKTKDRICIKAPVTEDEPSAPSVVSIWKTANWQEREVFDLYGITFDNHPDMRRILLWKGYDGHPLRKDYPLEGRGERDRFGSEYFDNL